jgi:hypothetical protein
MKHIILRLKALNLARRQGLYYTAKKLECAVEHGDRVRGLKKRKKK